MDLSREFSFFKNKTYYLVLLFLSLLTVNNLYSSTPYKIKKIKTPPLESKKSLDFQSINPSDVKARIGCLQEVVNILTIEMGRSYKSDLNIKIDGASPWAVYTQARVLNQKVNRLVYELMGNQLSIPEKVDPRIIKPYHVWTLVEASLKKLIFILHELGIQVKLKEFFVEEATKPDENLMLLVKLNRSINNLLLTPFSPNDVYTQVVNSVYLMDSIIEHFPEIDRDVKGIIFVRKKKPKHVFEALLESQKTLSLIFGNHSMIPITIHLTKEIELDTTIIPSDVYDLSNLVTSQIDYLHSKICPKTLPRKAFLEKSKLPAHVFKKVKVLNHLLDEFEKVTRQKDLK